MMVVLFIAAIASFNCHLHTIWSYSQQ